MDSRLAKQLCSSLLVLCLLGPAAVGQSEEERTDNFGDSLGTTQAARIGTWRLKHYGNVRSLDYSDDGELLASGATDGWAMVWQTSDGSLEGYDDEYDFRVYSVDLSPKGRILAVGDGGGIVKMIDLEKQEVLHHIEAHTDTEDVAINRVAFSPDGTLVVSACDSGHLRLWSIETGKKVHEFGDSDGDYGQWDVEFMPDGKTLVAAGSDGNVRFYSLDGKGESRRPLGELADSVNSVAVSPDGKLIAAGDRGDKLTVWSWPECEEQYQIDLDDPVITVRFTPDGKQVAGLTKHQVKMFSLQTGAKQGHVFVGAGTPHCFTFAPDGKSLALGVEDEAIHIVDLVSGDEFLADRRHTGGVQALSLAAAGGRIASCADDGRVFVWDGVTGKPLRILSEVADWEVWDVELLPDGKTVASLSPGPRVALWDVETGKLLRELPAEGVGGDLAVSPDGKLLAVAGVKKSGFMGRTKKPQVTLFDLSDGKAVRSIETGVMQRKLLFTPSGKQLIGSGDGNQIHLWSVETGEEVQVLTVAEEGEGVRVPGIAVDAAAKTLGAVCVYTVPHVHEEGEEEHDDHEPTTSSAIYLWELKDGKLRWRQPLDGLEARAIALSPDGKLAGVAPGSWASSVYDTEDGEEIAALQSHEEATTDLAFTPDGRHLITASLDTTLLVWTVDAILAQVNSDEEEEGDGDEEDK